MKFYTILGRNQVNHHRSDILFAAACATRGIEYVRLVEEDISLDDAVTMSFEPSSLLYRIRSSPKGLALESILARIHYEQLTTIYKNEKVLYPRKLAYGEIPSQMGIGLQIIPTCLVDETWFNMSDDEILKRIEAVDSFPIIIKSLGLSHGEGVMKIDDMPSLRAALNQLTVSENNVIIRKYLAHYRHFRFVVVDGKVVAPIEYHVPEDDFRTNASETPNVTALEEASIDPVLNELAIRAVALRNSIMGGVDLLIDQITSIPYVAEVNVPCYFPRSQDATDIDIAGQIIDALIRKSNVD